MQRAPRETGTAGIQFAVQRPGDLLYVPHLATHSVLTFDMGTTTFLAGWDCCNISIQELIVQFFIIFHPEERRNVGVNSSGWDVSTVSTSAVLKWTMTQKCTSTLNIWKNGVLTWSKTFRYPTEKVGKESINFFENSHSHFNSHCNSFYSFSFVSCFVSLLLFCKTVLL